MGRGTASTLVPTLTTERCILRAFREDDVPALAELHADPEVVRFLTTTGEPEPSLNKAWEYMAIHLGHWVFKGYGKWALVDRATDKLVGRVGFYDPPYEWPGLELGWTIARSVWGKGYASESARAALRWGFEAIDTDLIISAIHPDNARSIRVAERLGEKFLHEGTMYGRPRLIYGMSREDWRAAAPRS